MNQYLDKKLEQYADSDYYPFHMPGHKRQMYWGANPYSIDITEIDEFDNLHEATGVIKAGQRRAAALYGAKASYYLVNGSTGGILSAISASVKRGGKILMARNCHKAAYHGAYLRNLRISYLYPAITRAGIQGAISPESVQLALMKEKDIQAVILTSPTYDGIVSDIKEIAAIVHRFGIPLIVDEAHGAHFGFHEYFPETAVRLGADIVIQSLHKTLPSFTQTALLHFQFGFVKQNEIERFLKIYQTSSPSYIMMAGMDRCIRQLEDQGKEWFEKYVRNLKSFYRQTEQLLNIELLKTNHITEADGLISDDSKILIRAVKCGLNGKQLYDRLLHTYHLQMEMCMGDYVLAMTSVMDSEDGFRRLYQALVQIDKAEKVSPPRTKRSAENKWEFVRSVYGSSENCLDLTEAWDRPHTECDLGQAVGKIAGDFVNLYPPGIPILVPGERITAKMQTNLKKCLELHLNVQGITDKKRINVVN